VRGDKLLARGSSIKDGRSVTCTFGNPKLRTRVTESESGELIEILSRQAQLVDDPTGPPTIRSSDPLDDYLITLAAATHSVIVSGDHHLLDLGERLPVFSPTVFLAQLDDDT